MSVQCEICFNSIDFYGNRRLLANKCGHTFHGDCLSAWYKSGKIKTLFSNRSEKHIFAIMFFNFRKCICPKCRKLSRSEDAVLLCWEVGEKNDSENGGETSRCNSKGEMKFFFEKSSFINDELSITFGIKPVKDDDGPFIDFQNALL